VTRIWPDAGPASDASAATCARADQPGGLQALAEAQRSDGVGRVTMRYVTCSDLHIMSTTTIIILVLLALLVFGGGGYFYRSR